MTSNCPRPRLRAVIAAAGLTLGIVLAPSAGGLAEAAEGDPPDPGLRAQLMSSGLGVDVEGWNWAWDQTSGVKVELFASDGSGPIATADGFPSPLEHGHHFWVAFDTTFGPGDRIVATGYDSDITREVIVRDIRISHTDRDAGTVTGTAASADPVNVVANPAESGDSVSRLATPTDANVDGVFEWEVDFTDPAGVGESGDPLVVPIDVLTGNAELGSTGAKFSTPHIRVHTSGQQWWANVDWLDHLDQDVYLTFDNGEQPLFETGAVSPWINELGNAAENFQLNSIDGLMDAFGNGAGWTVSVVADADDTVLARVTLPLLTLDSVNTTTGEITGQADDGFEASTGGVDGYDSTWFDGTSSPWTWTTDVAERNITAMWNSMAGSGHDLHVNYAWPSFSYFLDYDETTDSYHHFLSSFHGAPLGIRGEFPDGTVTITIDDPDDVYDQSFPVTTYVLPNDDVNGFDVDLDGSPGIPADAVGPGWTFTATTDVDGIPMSKTLVIDHVSVDQVDNEAGTASGTCTPHEHEWIVQVGYGDVSESHGDNLYPECLPDGTWSIEFDVSQPASYVWASYQDGDLDVNTAAWYAPTETGGDPWISAIVKSGTVQFHGQWSGDPINITIDGVDHGNRSFDDCASGCDGLPVNVGSDIIVNDGITTKHLKVTNLSLLGVDPEDSTIAGTSSTGRDVEIDWGDTLTIPDDGSGTWIADFSNTHPFNGEAMGWASQTDDEGDQTWLWWSTPRLHIEPRGVVVGQGGWYEGDTVVVETFDPDGLLVDTFEVTAGSRDIEQDSWGIDPIAEFGVGYTVIASDRQTIREHEVRSVTIGEIDTDFDTVSGTTTAILEPGDRITVRADHCSRSEVPVTDGDYTADFSVPGAQPHEQDTCDLDQGSSGSVQHFDDDGDFTLLWWNVPRPPWFSVEAPHQIWANGEEWPLDATVEIIVSDDYDLENTTLFSKQATVEYWGPNPWDQGFNANLGGQFDIVPGHIVTVMVNTDDTTPPEIHKDLEVVDLSIDDPGNDTGLMNGHATPDSSVEISLNNSYQNAWRNVTAAPDTDPDPGLWSADLANLDPGVDGDGTIDVPYEPRTNINVRVRDDDGDATTRIQNVPGEPQISVWTGPPNGSNDWQWVEGSGWSLEVTVDIDDPDTPQSPDYTSSALPDENGSVRFQPNHDGFVIRPGFTVTVSDGQATRSHVVTKVVATDTDLEGDLVHGFAEPGSLVTVGIWGPFPFREVYAGADIDDGVTNGLGPWTADFSVPWQDQPAVDLVEDPGCPDPQSAPAPCAPFMGEAWQADGDGDMTRSRWPTEIPAGPVNVQVDMQFNHAWENISGRGWPTGPVTVSLDDTLGTFGTFDRTVNVNGGEWWTNPYEFDGFDPETMVFGPGWTVTATGDDGSGNPITKELIIPPLTIDGVDTALAEVGGTAGNGVEFTVDACSADMATCDSVGHTGTGGSWTVGLPNVVERQITAHHIDADADSVNIRYDWPELVYMVFVDENGPIGHWVGNYISPPGWHGDHPITIGIDDGDGYNAVYQTLTNDWGGFSIDLSAPEYGGLQPGDVGQGWTITATATIDGRTMEKTLPVRQLTMDVVDRDGGHASGTCEAGAPGLHVGVEGVYDFLLGLPEYPCDTGEWHVDWPPRQGAVPAVAYDSFSNRQMVMTDSPTPESFDFFDAGDLLISQTDGTLWAYITSTGELRQYQLPYGNNFDIQYFDPGTLFVAAQGHGVMALDLASGNTWPLVQDPELQAIALSIQHDQQRMFISDEDSGVWVYEWFNGEWWNGENATLTLLIDEVPDGEGGTMPASADALVVDRPEFDGGPGPYGWVYFANAGTPIYRFDPDVTDPETTVEVFVDNPEDRPFNGMVFNNYQNLMVAAGDRVMEFDALGQHGADIVVPGARSIEDVAVVFPGDPPPDDYPRSDMWVIDSGFVDGEFGVDPALYYIADRVGGLQDTVVTEVHRGPPFGDTVDLLIAQQPPDGGPGGYGEPAIQAYVDEEFFRGDGWMPDTSVFVTIQEYEDGPVLEPFDGFEIGVWGDGGFWYHVQEHELEQGLLPGMILTVTDGEVTKSLRLVEVRFDSFDPDTDILTADTPVLPTGEARLHLSDQNGNPMDDGNGHPIAVFPPEGPWSYLLNDPPYVEYDVDGLTEARIEVIDATEDFGPVTFGDDGTFAQLPHFSAFAQGNQISSQLFDNDPFVRVDVYRDEGDGLVPVWNSVSVGTSPRGDFHVEVDSGLQPGDEIVVTGLTTLVQKRLVLGVIAVDEFDVENDLIGGTAPSGATVEVGVGNGWCGSGMQVTADDDGHWVADFATQPGCDAETFDITDDMGAQATLLDPDMDMTVAEWQPPEPPHITADPFRERVRVFGFPDGDVTLTVFDGPGGDQLLGPLTTTVQNGRAEFDLMVLDPDPWFDLEAEHFVVVTLDDPDDGVGLTRELSLAHIGVEYVDDIGDEIHGSTDPGAGIYVEAGNQQDWGNRWIETEPTGEGTWVAEFGNPEDGATVDIDKTLGWHLFLAVPDGDGDATVYEPPNATPGLIAFPQLDLVGGEGSGFGPITIRVPDLGYTSTGDPVHDRYRSFGDFEQDVMVADREVYTYEYVADLSDQPNGLVPGTVVTLSDVLFEMTLTIQEFTVDEVNTIDDVVSGTIEHPEFVITFTSGPIAFGFLFAPDVGNPWAMNLYDFDGTDDPAVHDLTSTDVGISAGADRSPDVQPFDTYTAVLWDLKPHITALQLTSDPVEIDVPVPLQAAFTDIEVPDSHTAVIQWGDGQTTTLDDTSKTIDAVHTYLEPGIYTVVLTVTDAYGHSDSAIHQFVVVYDPEGGFVTGGGWIESPAGAFAADPGLVGRANFGFVAKYHKGKSTPDGNTNFQFRTADLHFESTDYDWLVISGGDHAKFKGVGTINGSGDFGFMVTAVDDTDGDTFRIKIWDRSTGYTVYDNKVGIADDGYDATLLGGGSIKVHDGR